MADFGGGLLVGFLIAVIASAILMQTGQSHYDIIKHDPVDWEAKQYNRDLFDVARTVMNGLISCVVSPSVDGKMIKSPKDYATLAFCCAESFMEEFNKRKK